MQKYETNKKYIIDKIMFGKNINDKKFDQRQQKKQCNNDCCQDFIVTITGLSETNFSCDTKIYSIA